MPRATICIHVDDRDETEAAQRWLQRWQDVLGFKSDNQGCGCCVDIYDVEGPQAAINDIPHSLKCTSDWSSSK